MTDTLCVVCLNQPERGRFLPTQQIPSRPGGIAWLHAYGMQSPSQRQAFTSVGV